jgi:hypothetical protein
MGTAKSARRRAPLASEHPRSVKSVCKLFATVFRRVLEAEGITVREAAAWMRVSTNTVQRHRTLGMFVPELASSRIALPFLRELALEVGQRNGRTGGSR